MKKIIVIIVIVFSSIFASAQSFDGVPISGDLPTAITRYEAKGYVLNSQDKNFAILKGRVASIYNVELYVYVTPKSKKVCKVVAFMDKESAWHNMKSQYEKFVNIIKDKYGKPDNTYNQFISPYYDGDGYEMTAVANEKCIFSSIWFNRNNTNIMVEISKYSQVKLVYENDENMELMSREKQSIENVSF